MTSFSRTVGRDADGFWKVTRDDVLENLTCRLESGKLPVELLCYRVFREQMDSPGSRYERRHKNNLDVMIEVARELLLAGKKKFPAGTKPHPDAPVHEIAAGPDKALALIARQVRLYVMFGPGWMFLPRSATERPWAAYFDDRTGSAMFPKSAIRREWAALQEWAAANGFGGPDAEGRCPRDGYPPFPAFHNCGIL